MRLRSVLGHKRIFGVFRAQGTCSVAANFLTTLREANIAPQNPLTGFEGQLHGLRKGKKKEWSRIVREGTGKIPRNKFLVSGYGIAFHRLPNLESGDNETKRFTEINVNLLSSSSTYRKLSFPVSPSQILLSYPGTGVDRILRGKCAVVIGTRIQK